MNGQPFLFVLHRSLKVHGLLLSKKKKHVSCYEMKWTTVNTRRLPGIEPRASLLEPLVFYHWAMTADSHQPSQSSVGTAQVLLMPQSHTKGSLVRRPTPFFVLRFAFNILHVHLASTRHHSRDRCSQTLPRFSLSSASVYCTEHKLKNKKKRGRPAN